MTIEFGNPLFFLLLLVLIPLIVLPIFVMTRKSYRFNRVRVTSMVLHIFIAVLAVSLMTGMTFVNEEFDGRDEVILVVGVSDSLYLANPSRLDFGDNPASGTINNFVRNTIRESNGDHRMGIVAFAREPMVAVPMATSNEAMFGAFQHQMRDNRPRGEATNISDALMFAYEMFDNPSSGRIILVSSGFETDGTALATVRTIAASGTRVDTVQFSAPHGDNEVRVVTVELPDSIEVGINTLAQVVVDSAVAGNATIDVRVNGVTASHPVVLDRGRQTFLLPFAVTNRGFNELRFEVRRAGDSIMDNNRYYTFVNIEAVNRVLVIEGSNGEAVRIRELLADYELEVRGVDDVLPFLTGSNDISAVIENDILAGLQRFDQVMLMGVSRDDLVRGGELVAFEEALNRFVYVYGGGLITTAGGYMYYEGQMAGTTLEQMLPVYASTAEPPMGVLVLMDVSSSMWRGPPPHYGNQHAATHLAHERTRWHMGIEIINQIADNLNPRDFLGVVNFDRDARVTLPMTRVTDTTLISQAICPNSGSRHVPWVGGVPVNTGNIHGIPLGLTGTSYYQALRQAQAMMGGFREAEIGRVIMITSGNLRDDIDSPIGAIIDRMYEDRGITFSVTHVGTDRHANDVSEGRPLLQSMAEHGRGQFHAIRQGAASGSDFDAVNQLINDAVMDLIAIEAGEFYNPTEFTPHRVSLIHPIFDQVAIQMPDLGGHFGTRARHSRYVMVSRGPTGDPIFATRGHGRGQVGSFMIDLRGNFSSPLFEDEGGRRFIQNVVSYHMPSTPIRSTDDIRVEFDKGNLTTGFRVTTNMNAGDTLTAMVFAPNSNTGQVVELEWRDGVAHGVFGTEMSGVFRLNVLRLNASGSLVSSYDTFFGFSYSLEYKGIFDNSVGEAFMQAVADNSGGRALRPLQEMFGFSALGTTRVFNPRVLFLILIIVLFIIDIAIRNFKFKWPWEIAKARKEKIN